MSIPTPSPADDPIRNESPPLPSPDCGDVDANQAVLTEAEIAAIMGHFTFGYFGGHCDTKHFRLYWRGREKPAE